IGPDSDLVVQLLVESDPVQLTPTGGYAFVALGATGEVAVIDARPTLPPPFPKAPPPLNFNFNHVVARIPIAAAHPAPVRAVATTPDLTLVLVTLASGDD